MSDAEQDKPLLQVQNLSVHLPTRGQRWGGDRRMIRAVEDVSLDIHRGRTLGLVGESGCGKSTLARAILRLIPATAGRVFFDGRDVFALGAGELRRLRRRMQIVFQDPLSCLNPRMVVEDLVGEALTVHGLVRTAAERQERVRELLGRVGLSPDALHQYPHEFSGGQRQRIGIARALALQPAIVICDEPVSALDVSVQSQIINLLEDLQAELKLSYLLIAHNLAVIRHCSNEVAVMYVGRIVEQGPAEEVYARPAHPYTRALLAAVPRLEPPAAEAERRPLPVLGGSPPSPVDPPAGCAFHPRCPLAEGRCREIRPELVRREGLREGHRAACHFAGGEGPG
ncbi:MAG: ABC transporter ATP-binding protein [Phycisphaerae bacterium]|jgi:oligopeptide transport system ATP-binding protein